jgi:arylsulfatase A-like enzyme
MATRPNILMVYADQWRAQATGVAGNPAVRTPHLDAFTATAGHCRQATSGTPACRPANYSPW